MSDKYPGGFVTANAPAGFSVAFDGTGDYLSMSSGTSLGAGNFTIECWVYLTAAPAGETTVGSSSDYYTAGFNGNFVFRVGTTNLWRSFDAQANQATIDGTFTWSTGQWYHMAWVRNSGTVTVYRNGTSLGSVADSKTLSDSTNGYAIAATKSGGSYSSLLTGYISNLRVVVGTALYTTTFTPPTQLLNISGTSLLTCNSPTIIDQSTNAYAITVSGDSKVSNFTPFAGYTGFNPALGAAAGGVWTLDEAAYYQNNRQWPIYDPYFNQTTLMLHGNGTNGAQNNTFLDSSSSPLTITRNGNTTQGSFSPFSQTGWSYNGTAGAYCTLNNADYSLGTGDFTVETWMYCVDDSTYSYANICSAPSNPNFTVGFGAGGGSGARQLYVEYGGSATGIGSNMSGYLNRWTHIAVVRQSGTVTAYQNGVSLGSISKSASVGSTASLYLLRNTGDTGMDFRGYISNYRITKAAVYSSNFTPSTAPFAPISNTVLLTFQDNRFVDNSALRATVTPAGTASIQAFSPFVPAYITPTTYSNWFDGTGDYLQSSTSTTLDLDGSINFTIEAWVYVTAWGSTADITYRVVGKFEPTGGAGYMYGMAGGGANQGKPTLYGNGGAINLVGTNVVPLNTWSHIAIVKNGTTYTHYLNGIANGSTTTGNTLNASTNPLTLAYYYNTAYTEMFKGCMSNVRIVKGTALYTAAFTPPTAPLTNISGTSLLTCQSSTFIDNSTANGGSGFTITANGNVQPVTSPTPFPAKVDTTTLNSAYSTSLIGGSGYFDGTGDYLAWTGSSITTSQFCFECWFYCTGNIASDMTLLGIANTTSGSPLNIRKTSATNISIDAYGVAAYNFTVPTMYANTWYHVAAVRGASNVCTVFLNGVRSSTGTQTLTNNFGSSSSIGYLNSASNLFFTGYISGARLTVGSSPYDPTTTGFAVPYAPPTAITNTQLLLNYTNAGIIDNAAKNVLETIGNAQISSTQFKYGNTSLFINGSGNRLLSYAGRLYPSGTEQFTFECWVYLTTTPSYATIFGGDASSGCPVVTIQSLTVLQLNPSGSAATLNPTIPTLSLNTWFHFACTRNSANRFDFWINGVSVGNATASTSYSATSTMVIGAADPSGVQPFTGYLDDVRITKGACRYLANFTPPTSQLQDQ